MMTEWDIYRIEKENELYYSLPQKTSKVYSSIFSTSRDSGVDTIVDDDPRENKLEYKND